MSEELLFDPQMLRVGLTLTLYLLFPLLIIAIFKRKAWMQRCGTVVAAYIAGLLMALTGLTHLEPDSMEEMVFEQWQTMIMNIAVPIAIPLMLFKCDFLLWTKALPKTIIAIATGVLSVALAALSGYWLLGEWHIPYAGKVAAMLTGIYTGGTMNFNALGTILSIDKTVMGLVLAFQMIITVPVLFSIITGGYKLMRRLLPYQDETTPALRRQQRQMEPPVQEVEDYNDIFTRENILGELAALGLSILFFIISVAAAYLAWWLGWTPKNAEDPSQPVISELIVILVITTLSIAASFSRKVRELPKTFEMGMFFILIFSVVVASLFDWHAISAETWGIGVFILWMLFFSLTLHFLLCRLFHVSGDLYTISITALLCSPPFVPPVVGAMGNKKVLISGIVIGLVGYAVGTYLGVGVAWLLGVL